MYEIEAGNKTFIHLTADSLTQQGCEKHEPFKFQDEEIWAPHIIEHEGLYYMYFTNIGVPRENGRKKQWIMECSPIHLN
jgi:hypothetical protein